MRKFHVVAKFIMLTDTRILQLPVVAAAYKGRFVQYALKTMDVTRPEIIHHVSLYDDVMLSRLQIPPSPEVRYSIEISGSAVTLLFMLHGRCKIRSNRTGRSCSLSAGSQNLFYLHHFTGTLESAGEDDLTILQIFIQRDRFLSLTEDMPAGTFFDKVQQRQNASWAEQWSPTAAEKHRLISELTDTSSPGGTLRIRREQIILKLLAGQLETAVPEPAESWFATHTFEIEKALEILDGSIQNPPTIPQLSKLVGLNEFTLKQNFKRFTGTTIYGYVTRSRMHQALELLNQRGFNVKETAYTLGYKNPQHFTAAFKRFFGQTPTEVTGKRT